MLALVVALNLKITNQNRSGFERLCTCLQESCANQAGAKHKKNQKLSEDIKSMCDVSTDSKHHRSDKPERKQTWAARSEIEDAKHDTSKVKPVEALHIDRVRNNMKV